MIYDSRSITQQAEECVLCGVRTTTGYRERSGFVCDGCHEDCIRRSTRDEVYGNGNRPTFLSRSDANSVTRALLGE